MIRFPSNEIDLYLDLYLSCNNILIRKEAVELLRVRTVMSRKNASLRSNLVHLIVFASSTYDTMRAVRSAADAVIYLSFSNLRDNTFSERARSIGGLIIARLVNFAAAVNVASP